LAQGKFQDAAQQLISISTGEELGLPPEDIALYGTLCGLASLERDQLQRLLEQTPGFLDLVPNLRDALQLYCRADYPGCLGILQQLYPSLERDVILAPHVEALFESILHRSCIEYLKPYRKVNLAQMANIFGIPTERLIAILAELIGSGKIEASRIDCQTQTLERLSGEAVLYRRQHATKRKLQAMEQNILNDSYAMMVRVACLESGSRQNFSSTMDYSDDDDPEPMDLVAAAGNPEDVY
jgi:COP9 signalosome complex subunit 1